MSTSAYASMERLPNSLGFLSREELGVRALVMRFPTSSLGTCSKLLSHGAIV